MIWVGSKLFRRLTGKNSADDNQASMVRKCVLLRENIAGTVALQSEDQKVLTGHSVKITRWAPVIIADTQRFYVLFLGYDITAFEKVEDEVGVLKEFQNTLIKGSQISSLDRACMMARVK